MLEYKTMIGMLSQKSNEPTKTKKAMKQTIKYLSIAALVVVGANMMSCNKVELSTEQLQEDKTTSNVVTLTTTVGLDGGATTRALTSGGVKTFAAGETIALVYKKTGGATAVAVSEALKDDGDIASGAKSATFTFTLEDPDNTQNVTYVYPAAMAKADGSINYNALSTQDGTLESLASNLDLATYTGAWSGASLPTGTLENQLAILAITVKDNVTPTANDITSTITTLSVGDGTNVYSVSRSAAAGPIYVAIKPTTSATIGVNASDGAKRYYKELTTKTYAASNGYSVNWKMNEGGAHLSALTGDYTANDGETLKGTLAKNVKVSIADGATVTLDGVTINGTNEWGLFWAGITCLGDATIILKDGTTNTVKGFYNSYPGVFVPSGKTLTINGTGSLNASSNGRGAGIGGVYDGASCGNIVIANGNITAVGGADAAGIGGAQYGTCGYITISGGTVNATGGDYAAGIGCPDDCSCGTITISGGTVIAQGGGDGAGIGSGFNSSSICADITISGGTVEATGGEDGAGIGSGFLGSCGDIEITAGVTSVTATKGSSLAQSIGAGFNGSCGTVTIEDPSKVTQN